MTRPLTIAFAAALASGTAHAQEMVFDLVPSSNTVSINSPTIEIQVWAGVQNVPAIGFAGCKFDTIGVLNWDTGWVLDYDGPYFGNDIFGDDEGQLQPNNDILNTTPAQLPPFFNNDFNDDNPIYLFTVEWTTTDFTPRQVCVDLVPEFGHAYVDSFGTSVSLNVIGDSLCIQVVNGNCPGDFNGDGRQDTLDVLDFLNAWTRGDRRADWNGDGTVNTQDVLGFLNDWITPC